MVTTHERVFWHNLINREGTGAVNFSLFYIHRTSVTCQAFPWNNIKSTELCCWLTLGPGKIFHWSFVVQVNPGAIISLAYRSPRRNSVHACLCRRAICVCQHLINTVKHFARFGWRSHSGHGSALYLHTQILALVQPGNWWSKNLYPWFFPTKILHSHLTKSCLVGVSDASWEMHRLHDVLQFFETSLKNCIVKNWNTSFKTSHR